MTEGPNRLLPITNYLSRLYAYPQSRIAFITIKDNTSKGLWTKIGKVNDWIRRYSQCYYIVKGMEGGIHFHLLAGIEKDVILRYQKGIHFHIKYINKQDTISPDYTEMAISKQKHDYYQNQQYEEQTMDVHVEKQDHINKICQMIKKYWYQKSNKIKRQKLMTKKHKSIERVISYLEKNLLEERLVEDLSVYHDYIIKTN